MTLHPHLMHALMNSDWISHCNPNGKRLKQLNQQRKQTNEQNHQTNKQKNKEKDLLPYKYKSVYISYDVDNAFTITVRHWILSEDKEVTEHYQVSRDEPGVGMAKQISTTTGLRTTLFFLITPFISCRLKQVFFVISTR